MVLIEVPASKVQHSVPNTSAAECDDSYSVQPPQHVSAPPHPASAPSVPVADLHAHAEPPVVWTNGGFSQNPTTVPSSEPLAFSFDLGSSATQRTHEVTIGTLPFSPVRKEEMQVQETPGRPSEAPAPPVVVASDPRPHAPAAVHAETPGRPVDASEEHLGETMHRSRLIVSHTVPISSPSLSYSSTFSSEPSRSTGTTPPEKSYAQSPPRESSLSYSQAARGTSFAQSSSQAAPLSATSTPASHIAYASGASSNTAYAGATASTPTVEPYSTSV